MTELLDPPNESLVEMRCRNCGVPLAADQRYCVSCGTRVATPRVPHVASDGAATTEGLPLAPTAGGATRAHAPAGPPPDRLQMVILAVAAIALPAFGLGLLIGDRGASPAPQVISVAAPPGPAAVPADASAVAFTDTWPAGTRAWTVRLVTLPKASTTPQAAAQARDDATSKGAPDVGTLDSDSHPPLAAGDYVVYSGVFPKREDADAALQTLRENFPDASVIRIDAEDDKPEEPREADGEADDDKDAGGPVTTPPADPSALSPEEFQKRSKKLPSETAIPGDAPAPDGAAPGGEEAGEAVEIG